MEAEYIKVSVRGKLFRTTKEILERSEYFRNLFDFKCASASRNLFDFKCASASRNLFRDTQVEDTIYFNRSPYAFREVLKYLENKMHPLDPEYHEDYDFFLLDFMKDYLVVRTDTKFHFFGKSYLNRLAPEKIEMVNNVWNLLNLDDNIFVHIYNSMKGHCNLDLKYMKIARDVGVKYYQDKSTFMINGDLVMCSDAFEKRFNTKNAVFSCKRRHGNSLRRFIDMFDENPNTEIPYDWCSYFQ